MTINIMKAILIFAPGLLLTEAALAKDGLIIKLKTPVATSQSFKALKASEAYAATDLGGSWMLVESVHGKKQLTPGSLPAKADEIEFTQPDYPIHLLEDYRMQDPLRREALQKSLKLMTEWSKAMPADNPPLPTDFSTGHGGNPDLAQQWGMNDIGAPQAWRMNVDASNIIVAVIDSGTDYTHEDLRPNLWRNPGEMGLDANGKDKSTNGLDDDGNGLVDDLIGWDFVSEDNKPFDLAVEPIKLLTKGGNPGHGTHCAGNVGARGENGLGISGVAPNVKIMSLRFISEQGAGSTSAAIRAIRYAVDKGAKVLSNSWGSEGEDPASGEENRALRDAVEYAKSKGVLFVAAAGNGHKGKGYDNDNDPLPAFPASYTHDNIISVAAIDENDRLGGFSNWGLTSVDIAAPGLRVYSTTVGGMYSDKVIDLASISVDWDGTSMAAPHVAGAVALYWAAHPNQDWKQVKQTLLDSATRLPQLQGRMVSGGKLNALEMMKR